MRGYAPLGRIVGLAMIVAGLGTATLATAEHAVAATADSPTAIAVSSGGTSYVGFANGGVLQRISVDGKRKPSVPLDQDEAVDGLFVTPGDDIWVDYETGMSLLAPGGRVIAHFDHSPVRDCDPSASPHRYGGITAHGNRIYVANRCDDSVSVYARNGDLQATVDLPGTDHPRGITYGGPQAGRPAMLYVAVPDRGQVLAYKAASLRDSSKPSQTFTLRRPGGGHRPAPGGIAVDKWGQLVVTDMANNAVYLVDTNHDFSLYRTLGHPPRAGRAAGRLSNPTAIAQHDQDGGSLSGDLFIADTGNGRAQRWNTSGYTYWATNVRPGSGAGGGGGDGEDGDGEDSDSPPSNTVPPAVTGTPQVGSTLSCSSGSWSGASFVEHAWLRDGGVIGGATGSTYQLTAADAGAEIGCRVRAGNDAGTSAWAYSDPVTVSGSGSGAGPANLSPPAVSGTPAVGHSLTCSTGTWSGGGSGPFGGGAVNTYAYQWRRDGGAIGGATAASYTVVAADSGAVLTCVVTATNGSGSTQQASAPVTVTGAGPVNQSPPVITGTPAVGQTLTCGPGSWSGATGYAFAWRRDGTLIGGATTATYAVVAADSGRALTCVVTATNGTGGSAQQTSRPVTVTATGPANTVPPIVSGSAGVGEVLTCLPGGWSGTGLGFAYIWRRDGTAIAQATWSAYTVLSPDVGTTLTCAVTATNGQGSATATSAGVVISGPSGHAPSNLTSPAVTGTAAAGQTVTCDPGTWAGTPELVQTYTWQRNGADVSGATAATYAVGAGDAGASLRCVVVVANGYGKAALASPGVAVAGGGGSSSCLGQIGVSVNGGATRVTSPDVLLGIVAPSGVTSVTVSDDLDFATPVTMPVTPSCTYAWTLRSTPGASTMSSVFVRFGASPMVFGYSILVDRTGG
ncbi:hypothetical protein [Nocardioides sp. T2.26MG-1]|uniref:hypothetical protein n=1 Tax=Nocardioides sp. T2.26MG-1 TaxID=3041166 RepID=UPI0024776679|nr:hypothetical protein [Nocardioides sp. T2.26MG-1]CAI9403570.1 hypothetical protein HIDPHFAB_04008 [Nocardioides sp. T2.26MG-1]